MPEKRSNSSRFVKRLVLFSAAAAVAVICFFWWRSSEPQFIRYEEFGIPMPASYPIHGIDVSKYQQAISWSSVKAMKVKEIQLSFAFIKATEGIKNTDPFFKRNWKKAREAGVIRGAYHYFIARKDGRTQAQNFIQAVSLESGDLPPVLDIEQTFGQPVTIVQQQVKAWLEVMEEHYAVKPIIYTNVDFYEHYLQGYFDDYPLWVAHYLQWHHPRISRSWTFWQHSEGGRVNGIMAPVDFNVFNGDSVAFKSILVP